MVRPMMTFVRKSVVFVSPNGQFLRFNCSTVFFLKRKKRKSGYFVCKQCIQDSTLLPPGEEEIFQS